MPIFRLSEKNSFPPPYFAEPEGLLAVGGDLSKKRILLAYQMGIFPWFTEDEPILWWSPDPRLLLYPSDIYVSKRLKRIIRQGKFKITCDTAFDRVISTCASVRVKNFQETWIGDAMIEAYCRLFESGYAHSVEVWHRGELAGGLYGLSLGGSFFGESMFSLVSNTSKIALVALCRFLNALSFDLIDCQVTTAHLKRMGAVEVSRSRYLKQLQQSVARHTLKGNWKIAFQEFQDRCT
ncbi:MAG: leucyl/phenylalanyl-tRNA--protein transferase [Desulfobacteraceae bacterium]|nr:leucyl/phenylalanyl-tRNA--protein transferase [Desulfobacteraceae bacterium]MBC2754488.1 leucyl/phenylalanyl-tRNA--protein transferase [Desulfobacteraceae bacterium]